MAGREVFKEGRDYYVDSQGRLVMTAYFLRKRGFCCGNRCRHCPYGWEKVRREER